MHSVCKILSAGLLVRKEAMPTATFYGRSRGFQGQGPNVDNQELKLHILVAWTWRSSTKGRPGIARRMRLWQQGWLRDIRTCHYHPRIRTLIELFYCCAWAWIPTLLKLDYRGIISNHNQPTIGDLLIRSQKSDSGPRPCPHCTRAAWSTLPKSTINPNTKDGTESKFP